MALLAACPLVADDAPEPQPTWPPQPTDKQFTLTADHIYYYDGATGLQGNVVVVHQGITIRADVGEIDADRIWGQFRGNVTIVGENYSTTVERLRVNFDTEEWTLDGGRATLSPEYFDGEVLEPIYIHGGTVQAGPGGEPVEIYDATVTSCDLDHPHYGLTTRHATVRGDNKLVLRTPALEFFGHRIIRYPWDLVLSTDSEHNRFIPEFGQSSVEGYYAKLAPAVEPEPEARRRPGRGPLLRGQSRRRAVGVFRAERGIVYHPRAGQLRHQRAAQLVPEPELPGQQRLRGLDHLVVIELEPALHRRQLDHQPRF
jgi:lipopolysaccharide assembly outer membrane protein LptD (OstA)